MPAKFCNENVNRKDSAEDTGIYAKPILEWILYKKKKTCVGVERIRVAQDKIVVKVKVQLSLNERLRRIQGVEV